MKISLIQTALTWEDPQANRANFEKLINGIGATDLIILPEMFATGFTMKPEAAAETMGGATVAWMKEIAAAKDSAITGSLVIEENGNYYNRLLFVFPDGEIKTYNKRHLFSLAGEEKAYTAGTEKLIVEYKGWKICPQVCYDLRFPVFARNVEEYDLLLYVANWPSPRIFAWDTLLKARAIENMCYVAGVNRIGEDANGHPYPGHSQVLDCLGAMVADALGNEGAFSVELDREKMLETRKRFGFLNDRDRFTLQD
ncbi:amidohydrolase [Flavobacterium sp. MFBS3-15]|uniref:amidohydrolase n=1 Tax=Flavobacterium sp. MFBS3-15 TaxID=2989816 RepID=UPI002236777E|nr:amidohydrolase [Flavobacterium sp. MFBS3-15]MCW4469971.1 amidohydrolase [Flavobacterium sp. MFBS3-15]